MMAGSTNIEWTDCTWNPTVGCTICAAGCRNCYAMRMAARLEAMGVPHYAGTTRKVNGKAVWSGKIAVAPDGILTQPLLWKKPRRIFVNSMSDLFHEDVPDEVIDRVFAVMALCPQHVFQVLTKRPARMRAYMDRLAAMLNNGWDVFLASPIAEATRQVSRQARHPFWMNAPLEWCDNSKNAMENPGVVRQTAGFPPRNVWLGASVSTQADADAARDDMRALADAGSLTFVSYEPALGPVDWTGWEFARWIISGGESGPGARPSHPDWHRAARDFCAPNGVAYFLKQWGEWHPRSQMTDDQWSALHRFPKNSHMADLRVGSLDLGNDLAVRVGKKLAGALLDGREHKEWPGSPQRTEEKP